MAALAPIFAHDPSHDSPTNTGHYDRRLARLLQERPRVERSLRGARGALGGQEVRGVRVVDRIVHLEVGHRAIDLAPLLGVDGGDLAEAPPRVPLLAIGALGGGSGWEAVGPASPPSGAASSGLPLARAAASLISLRAAIPRSRIFWMPASPFGLPHCVHASRASAPLATCAGQFEVPVTSD